MSPPAQKARPLGIDDHELDLGIADPAPQGRVDLLHHRAGERIERRRPAQRDAARAADLADQHVAHAAPKARATITRMISLVPSRIWCTRRSRTIFSMP